jgi:UDP-N-acetylglucosamine--N-acetylmuramyl-(pentapeptide) pyrophosphoryl-undecaprenol N-acetylglucosamine transferase
VCANAAGIVRALGALARFKPMWVVATGGYVCFPVVVAARILRLLRIIRPRIALLEINVTPGLTNRLLKPLVDEVWTTYAASERSFGAKTERPRPPGPRPRPHDDRRDGRQPRRTLVRRVAMGAALV